MDFGLQDKNHGYFFCGNPIGSNMFKACLTRDEAIATQEHYAINKTLNHIILSVMVLCL
jgi:hypothetical protein